MSTQNRKPKINEKAINIPKKKIAAGEVLNSFIQITHLKLLLKLMFKIYNVSYNQMGKI